jgi:hypothetical protein
MALRPPHLLLALSGHGYGHLAQCAPVVNALRQWLPELALTVCGGLSSEVVADRIEGEFDYRQTALDPILQMLNAWEVDVPASRRVYREFHRNWAQGYRDDIDLLRQVRPGLVLADVPYRILLAAAERGIPAVGLCSLNWAAIYAAYCEDVSEDRCILEQITKGYRAVDLFLAPTPAIPMPELDNVVTIGPIARQGCRQQEALLECCGIVPGVRAVLVALGGIATTLPVDNWPHIDDVIWIFTDPVRSPRQDMFDLDMLDVPFIDALASVEAVLTKPGYGTYAEAVCHGVPILALERQDWPETVYLNGWVQQHGHLEVMTREQFLGGRFAPQVTALLAKPVRPGIEPDGIRQAVEILIKMIK